MDLQNKQNELLYALRALNNVSDATGWQTIKLSNIGPCKLMAGRKFPGNEESLLIGFNKNLFDINLLLPSGKGFSLYTVNLEQDTELIWVVLSRQSQGDSELFIQMLLDIISLFESDVRLDQNKIFYLLLQRIKAWQDFMQRELNKVMSIQSQIGLFGELIFLRSLINLKFEIKNLLNSWGGPLNSLHDFNFKKFSVEVKTTTSVSNFKVKIGSLFQLDPLIKSPLYLLGIKLEECLQGETLTDIITNLREIIKDDEISLTLFNYRVKMTGFIDESSSYYTNRYKLNKFLIFEITEYNNFPFLSQNNVPKGITSAEYEIELDDLQSDKLSMDDIFNKIRGD